jgi:hypothetical protein
MIKQLILKLYFCKENSFGRCSGWWALSAQHPQTPQQIIAWLEAVAPA